MTVAKLSAATVGSFYMRQCWIKDLNGELSHNKRKPQEAAWACQHHIQFMIKDYPQQSVKSIETLSEENYLLSTRLQMWRLRKWQIRSRVHSSIDRNLSQAMSELERLSSHVSIHHQSKKKQPSFTAKHLTKA